jgi:mannose-1-phosphate guanylyltransferase
MHLATIVAWGARIEDTVVVEMSDMTVICHKSQIQRVKELAEQQKKRG